MKRKTVFVGVFAVFITGMTLLSSLVRAQGAVPTDPQVQQLQAQVQTLTGMLRQAQETDAAQSTQLVAYHQQIDQLQQGMGPACKATVEKANPTQTLDDKTWVLSPKKPEKAKE